MRRWVLENPKVVAIIQARMSSKRLPNKVLADIAGRPMLWQVVDRVRRVQSLDQVVVATSEGPMGKNRITTTLPKEGEASFHYERMWPGTDQYATFLKCTGKKK